MWADSCTDTGAAVGSFLSSVSCEGSHLNQVNCENGPATCWQTIFVTFQSESMKEGEREKERETQSKRGREKERDGMEVVMLEIPASQDRGGSGEKHQF